MELFQSIDPWSAAFFYFPHCAVLLTCLLGRDGGREGYLRRRGFVGRPDTLFQRPYRFSGRDEEGRACRKKNKCEQKPLQPACRLLQRSSGRHVRDNQRRKQFVKSRGVPKGRLKVIAISWQLGQTRSARP